MEPARAMHRGAHDSMAASLWVGIVLASGIASLAASALFARRVLAEAPATEAMSSVARAIREGAHAFLRRQTRAILTVVAGAAAALAVVYGLARGAELAFRTTVAFATGAACSAGAGAFGMFVSVRANERVAAAARTSLRRALLLAVYGGAAAALPVVALALLGVAGLFFAFGGLAEPTRATLPLVGFAFGASVVALFAQLGGGIYTKAADIGADLVGKLDARIPEDDPRNPAVIADLVGDNVGDCAGRGADIFQSVAAEIASVLILGVALSGQLGPGGLLFPLVASALGLLASIPGVLAVRLRDESGDPIAAMTRGHVVTFVLSALALFVSVRALLGPNPYLFLAALVGLVAGAVLAGLARYYTGARHRPVAFIATSSATGAPTNVIAGIAVALESTALPVLAISVALLAAYGCGLRALPSVPSAGIYGTAVATVGMLSTVGFVLSMDMFGPIVDNAGGIVEMSGEPAHVRARTDRLDAAGNTTKASTKGYAIGSAALAAFLLFFAYLRQVSGLARDGGLELIDLGKPPVFVGALLGGAIAFAFSGLAIRAVTRDAGAVIEEVRRQFGQSAAILSGAIRPDYGRCVDIVTASALEGMIAPGLLAILAPLAFGLSLRALAPRGDPLLGAEAVAALMMVATISAVLLGLAMNTGGAAWDNAKKRIEAGELGGKGSPAHAAAVVGDAVGDPLKDTAGPSLHVLIKLLGTLSLVASPLLV